jgi:uncharacterized membrane protein YhhN
VRLIVRPQRSRAGAVAAAVVGLAALCVRLLHLDHLPIPLCTFRALTGIPCMSCGATRAFGRLARLDPAGALAFHPLATVAALGVVVWGLLDVALSLRRRSLRLECTRREWTYIIWSGALLLIANWAYLVVALR